MGDVVIRDRAGGGEPDVVARLLDVAEGAAERAQPEGLAHDERVQRDAEHQGLLAGLPDHLVVIGDDHVGESLGSAMVENDHRDVVHLVRVGEAEDAALAGADPDGLVVHRPVENVAVAGLLQQVGRRVARIDSRAEPSRGLLALVTLDRVRHVADKLCLARFVEIVLMLGVAAPMTDDLVAAFPERGDHLRAMIVNLAVEQQRDRQLKLVEQLQQAPNADPVAVFAPTPVIGVGMRQPRRVRHAKPLAIGEMLKVQAYVNREALSVGPLEIGPIDDRAVGKSAVRSQH